MAHDPVAALTELICDINSTLDLDQVLTRVMEAARTVLDAEGSSLLLHDPATEELVFRTATGPARDSLAEVRIPASEGIAGWVFTQGRSAAVADVAADPRHLRHITELTRFEPTGLVAVPVRNRTGERIGVLEVVRRGPTRRFAPEEVRSLEIMADHAAVAITNARLFQAQTEKTRMEQQMALARLVQQQLLPDRAPVTAGLEVAVLYEPARALAGDLYGFYRRGPGRLGVVVGDVMGKNVPAALMMATTHAYLRAFLEGTRHPLDEGLGRVRELLRADLTPGQFVSLFVADLDPEQGVVEYINAGHPAPILVPPGGSPLRLDRRSVALGIPVPEPYRLERAELPPGSVLVLFTDGLTERRNAAGEEFGEERLQQLVVAEGGGSVTRVAQALREASEAFGAETEGADDLTVLVIRHASPGC